MPFEPLRTDEKLEAPQKREKDFDSLMLAGCSSFSITAFVLYGISALPFYLLPNGYEMDTLLICMALSVVPSLIFVAIASRKAGIPGAAGSVCGSFATAIFVYLRLSQFNQARGMWDLPQPEFPQVWELIVPSMYILLTLVAAVIFVDRSQFETDGKST